MSMTVVSYLLYLSIAVPLTWWVARTLSHNGRLFLVEVFQGNEELAGAVNRLLVVGFYLVNLGFVTLFVRGHAVTGVQDMIERLSAKLGVVLLVLGVLHLFNVYVFGAIRRRSRFERPAPAEAAFPPAEAAVTHAGY
ncbi:MAG TPA: hypothetical protein VGJ44_13165 [Kribbellaceae bacterium]|jgi:hypothetical protein